MDSLPALHPIVLDHISSRPFKYSPKGLTFNGYPREDIADLKRDLFPKRKNAASLNKNKNKDWWVAQLRLYGINDVKASVKKEELIAALKRSLRGLSGPPEDLLQLEQKLARKFLLENAEAREKEYVTLSEEKRAEKYSDRYLREKFCNGTENETLVALAIGLSSSSVHHAATKLGLHCETTCGPEQRMWTIIGKKQSEVRKRTAAIGKEFQEWESEERDVKRRKVEIRRQGCEAGGAGCFKEVEGEWNIECPKMDEQWSDLGQRRMSIFFQKPSARRHMSDDEDGYPSSDFDDDDEAEAEEHDGASEVDDSPILCANFKMGIVNGMLRSKGDLPAQSSSFPVPKVPFTWRGAETGEGMIELDYQGNINVGSFSFVTKTQLNGVFKNDLGKWPFTGFKVAKTPADTEDTWEDYSEEAYERARVGRW
ncbi:hypothetical protein KC19_3G172000 [Ceratodon purpureus]|uniref:Uncharacterized protein n=1 Tax=Ceratodon purpureus TaxID=3225 RepID=A0A8T0IM16_CERPU|nr:hypothetical protein KC19_3G172000 [Ceratodon purpureus]